MTLKNTKQDYFVSDIEPTIAVVAAEQWERNVSVPLPKPMSEDLIKQSRIARSAYQHELIRGFARFLLSWLYPHRPTRATQGSQRRVPR